MQHVNADNGPPLLLTLINEEFLQTNVTSCVPHGEHNEKKQKTSQHSHDETEKQKLNI